MTTTAPTILRPSSRFYAAFHRYLTTTFRTAHPIYHRHPHPPHLTTPSRTPHIPRYYTTSPSPSTTTTTTSSPSTTPTPPTPTYYTLFPATLPHGPPPHSPFTPDLRSLRKEYLSLQSHSHPDKHPSGPSKAAAETRSALINDAYRTLLSPLKRAEYLLGLRGVELGEGMVMDEEDEDGFLEEVMEVRSQIDGAGEEGELESVRRANEGRIEGCVRGLEGGFEELGRVEGGDGGEEGVVRGLVRETVRLRYWIGVRESLDGWERGKGGGVLGH